MDNTYWFIPSRVDEAIHALTNLGYLVSIREFRRFAGKHEESRFIVYRLKGGLAHSVSSIESFKKGNPQDTYIDLLGPTELILTDEYKESQDSFAELCNPTEYPF